MESEASNNDDFLHALEIPDDGLDYVDVDKLDPSTVYCGVEDRHLKSLPELQREAIIAQRLDKLKRVTEMRRALSRASSRFSDGSSHHLWPFFKNSPDEKTSEPATDEAIDEGIQVDGNTTVGDVTTADGNASWLYRCW